MENVLENHGNPSKFWEKNVKRAGKSWKSWEWEMCWKIMEILRNSGRRMGNVLGNHGNPRKFWEKNGKCGNPRKFREKNGQCAGKSWKS